MSVQRIVSADGSTNGWQARQHVGGNRYLSRFFAVRKHGGVRKALALAQDSDEFLRRQALRLKWIAR